MIRTPTNREPRQPPAADCPTRFSRVVRAALAALATSTMATTASLAALAMATTVTLATMATIAGAGALAPLHAQAAGPASPSAAASTSVSAEPGVVPAGLLIRQLDGVKRVLMIGAHPDDEDTSLLAALARAEGAQVAYLSLNRGEGGQNLIGPEMEEGLGIVRTGELLSARALDGAEQYFTRAFDFGFSKSAEETFGHWPREEVLADVVRVIRSFRPQVIVSIFSGTERDGHGQHQVAGMLSEEAFDAAGDPGRFPGQMATGVEPWQPLKFYRLTRWTPEDATVAVETGRFDPLLGRSHFQLASESRSQHRSQDMGVAQPGGPRWSGARLERSLVSEPGIEETSLFDGIDTTLLGLFEDDAAGGGSGAADADLPGLLVEYREAVAEAGDRLDALRPWRVAEPLARAVERAREASALLDASVPTDDGHYRLAPELHRKGDLAQAALLSAAGVVLDVQVDRDLAVPGEPLEVQVELWNGGPLPLENALPELSLPPEWEAQAVRSRTLAGGRSGPGGDVAGSAGAGSNGPGSAPGGEDGGDGVTPAPASGFEPADVGPGGLVRWTFQVHVPENSELSRLYYLEEERDGALYRWPADPSLHGLPVDPPLIEGSVGLTLLVGGDGATDADAAVDRNDDDAADTDAAGSGAAANRNAAADNRSAATDAAADRTNAQPIRLRASRPGSYVGVDKARGEFRSPVLVVPAISVAVEPEGLVWPLDSDESRMVTVEVDAYSSRGVEGEVTLEVPDGWRVSPASHALRMELGSGSGADFAFEVRAEEGELRSGIHRFQAAVVAADGRSYREGFDLIDYPHIERVAHFHPAEARVSAFPVRVAEGLRVGYVMGSGDAGFETLRQLGMDAELLDSEAVRRGDFGGFDVIVLGVRAYETRSDLAAANDRLIDFARRGGTVLVQYNKYEYPAGGFAPFPVDIARPHDRVTDPEAPVTLLEPDSPVFRTPNRIIEADFEGWVQERGLYFLGEWDDRYTPLLGMSDPGEEMKRGALLVAPVGDGLYIYTGLAFFRQLPAGVAGAHRLFANLVSLRAQEWSESASSTGAESNEEDAGSSGEGAGSDGRETGSNRGGTKSNGGGTGSSGGGR